MWQQTTVYIIGIATLAYIGIGIYRAVRRRKDPCAHCFGCDLCDLCSKRDKKRKGK